MTLELYCKVNVEQERYSNTEQTQKTRRQKHLGIIKAKRIPFHYYYFFSSPAHYLLDSTSN